MSRMSLLRPVPVAVWLAALVVALCGSGYWAIRSSVVSASDAVDDVAREDASEFAQSAGILAGYELTIAIADAHRLLASPVLAGADAGACSTALDVLGSSAVSAVVFHRGDVLCSRDAATGVRMGDQELAWSTAWWRQVDEEGFEVHGAERVGEGTFTATDDGFLAMAVAHGDLGYMSFLPLSAELGRHLATLGDRAVAIGMLDRSGRLIAAADRDGELAASGEFYGDASGELSEGPAGVTARWAAGRYGQKFGSLLVGVNPTPTDTHLAVFQTRANLAAAGVGGLSVLAIGAVVAWGAWSLRRVAAMVEAAADGFDTELTVPRHAPVELARLGGTLVRLGQRRRTHDLARESARQQESADLGLALHDDVIQRLAAASLLSASNPVLAVSALRDTAARIRNLSAALCPPLLAEHGLAAAIAVLGERDLDVRIEDHTAGRRFALTVEQSVYRNVVEAAHNAVLHGAATAITVTLRCEEDELEVRVVDNGAGIDPSMCNGRPGHFGIVSMQDLMGRLGGTATVEPTAAGTRVLLRCPVAGRPAPGPHRRDLTASS